MIPFRKTVLQISLGLLCFGLNRPVPVQAQALDQQAVCTQLQDQIRTITQRPEFARARWGILVQTLGATPRMLYAQDAEKLFIPASNVKLLTTAAALTRLGPDFRVRTVLYQIPQADGSVVLQVVGQGDPSFTTIQLQSLTAQLQSRGIERVQTLIADAQRFGGDFIHPHWDWEDVQAGYGTAINSLILNQNAIGLTLTPQGLGEPLGIVWDEPAEATGWRIVNRSRTVDTTEPEFVQVGRDLNQPVLYVSGQLRMGSTAEPVAISIPQPTQHFLNRFQTSLTAQGIQIDTTTIATDPLPAAASEIAAVPSPPLAELLVETNQFSNNLYAEALLRWLGLAQFPQTNQPLEAGINALETVLTNLGVNADSYDLADGSGLSRQNLVSPQALVATLQAMERSPYRLLYRNSLSRAGISGTLRSRFQNSVVEGRFYSKTGALKGVVALSGYLERNGSPLVISLLINQATMPMQTIRAALDEIVINLAESDCEEET